MARVGLMDVLTVVVLDDERKVFGMLAHLHRWAWMNSIPEEPYLRVHVH